MSLPIRASITLTLKADTIKALRLLALLKDESQNDVAEALLIAGGLHNAVDSEWSPGQPKPMAPAPIPQAPPAPPKPVSPRDGWMPKVPNVADDTEVSPYLKDDVPW